MGAGDARSAFYAWNLASFSDLTINNFGSMPPSRGTSAFLQQRRALEKLIQTPRVLIQAYGSGIPQRPPSA
jgi:hypothetical protein